MNMSFVSRSVNLKHDREIFAEAAAEVGNRYASRSEIEWFAQQMKNRLFIGEMRYASPKWAYRDADQEAKIGPEWRLGYDFFATQKGVFEKGYRSKARAYMRSGNTELIIDTANYAMFCAIVGDQPRDWAVTVLTNCLREFFNPTHPEAHYRALDQDIDGQELSGSITNDPRVRAQLTNVAR